MRRVLNPLLGRNFKLSHFRRRVESAFSRLETLKNHRHDRYSEDRHDVVRLLQQDGLHKLALTRCEQVIKHQNLLDAYGMIEGYLNLLMERIYLLGRGRECPDELKEAVSGVVFAASRCKEFPELEEIKSVLTSRFGKNFTGRAVELRNNSGVNQSIMQKLSTRKPNMESKMNLLKAIAYENGIALQLDEQGEPRAIMKENTRSVLESNVPSSSTQTRHRKRDVALTRSSYRTRCSNRRR